MGVRKALSAMPSWARWVVALTLLRAVLGAIVPITPEEAYHWNYARHLDWSYYDHPPTIAWAIALGRLVLGDTVLGVRAVPIIFGTGTALLLAQLADRFYGQRAAVWAVLLISIQPITLLASSSGFPDAPLLFFWTLALTCVWRALDADSGLWWLAAGASLGLAALSKYTAAFLGLSVLLYLMSSSRHRRWLHTPWPYLAAGLSLLVFTPVLWWNWVHDWDSFRYQSVERLSQANEINPLAAAKFMGQQWLGVLPLTLPLGVAAAWGAARSAREDEKFLLWSLLPMVTFFFLLSWGRSIHVLWPLPAYVGLTVLMAGTLARADGAIASWYEQRKFWLLGVTGALLIGAGLHLAFFLPGLAPVRGLYGWNIVAGRARMLHASLRNDAFYVGIGRKYVCASQLAFHLRAPHQVHGQNLIGQDGLQYNYWVAPATLAGRDAVLVVEDSTRGEDRLVPAVDALRRSFRLIEPAGEIIVPIGRQTLVRTPPARFYLYVGRGYLPSQAQRSGARRDQGE